MTHQREALWAAINKYAEACGGDTSSENDSDRRMNAVVAVEKAVDAEVQQLKDDQKALVSVINAPSPTIGNLEAELARYKRWVDDLQSGMYINCVYCGHRYGPDDKVPASMADALKEHVENCPEHPMSKLKKELEEAKQKIAEIQGNPSKPEFLEVAAAVRYWEDATVNGQKDEEGSLIPCREDDVWRPVIELSTGCIEDWPDGVEARIHYKICDAGEYWLADLSGNRLFKWKDDYVPRFLGIEDDGFGDYIIFNVSCYGKIENWKSPEFNPDEWEEC